MSALYRCLGISKQAVHQRQQRSQQAELRVDTLYQAVDKVRRQHPGCGMRKLYEVVNPQGIGRDRCIDLLIAGGYRISRKRRRTVTTIPGRRHFDNLIEGMEVSQPNQVWQSDTTYFPLANGDFGYITFMLDVYSREVKGYEVANTLRAEGNERLLRKTLRAQGSVRGLIHHSDRGSQYGSRAYLKLQHEGGIHTSMGLIAQDNAYAERINGIIKNEYLSYWDIRSVEQLKRSTRKAVEHYNTQRKHGSIGRLSPVEFHQKWLTLEPHERPKVTIYAEGKSKSAGISNPYAFPPQESPAAPNCPWADHGE